MNKILVNETIVESAPIIGICNKVIKPDLDIVTQIQYFAFCPKKLLDAAEGSRIFTDFFFWLANVRAGRLRSLAEQVDYEDFNPQYGFNSAYWLSCYSGILEDATEKGFVEQNLTTGKVNAISHSDNILNTK